jgi:cytochrome P450
MTVQKPSERSEDVAELLARFDVFDDAHFERMDEVLTYAREKCPVAHSTADGGLHLVTTYDEVKRVLSDPETFSSKEASPRPTPIALPPLTVDAPLHGDFRKVIQRFFTRPYLRKHEEEMREIARECIARFLDKRECDFVRDFALPYTSATTAKVVFDEDDPNRMDAAAAAVERVVRENSPEAYQGLAELAAAYMQERASSAADRDDLISAVVTGQVGGRPMTPEEQIGMVTVLFLGALDTTRGAIANIAAAVARDPELQERLHDPDWLRHDLDEFLRHETPVLALRRLVARDCTLGGAELKAGDIVMMMFASANRDESVYPRADQLDFENHRAGHLAFGYGVHRCLGATMAQVLIGIAFEELFKQVENLRLAGPDAGPDYGAGAVYTPTRLDIEFDRVAG